MRSGPSVCSNHNSRASRATGLVLRFLGRPGAMDGVADRYAWVDQIEAWTVAVVCGRPADEVLGIYGGDPAASVGDHPFAQLADLQGSGSDLTFHAQLLDVAGRVVVIENNGWSGSLPEIARRCSADGAEFFSVSTPSAW